MSRPKRQHYVTRAYLEGFLSPGESLLYCYGRGRNESFKSAPINLANQRDFYSFKDDTGAWDDSAEKMLGRHVEEPGLNVLRKLVSGNFRLSNQDREKLSILIAMQEMRTPFARKQILEALAGLSKSILDPYERIPEAFRPDRISIAKGEYEAEIPIMQVYQAQSQSIEEKEKRSIYLAFDGAIDIAQIYRHMKWTVFISPKNAQFVTTDCPVIRVYYRGPGGAAALNRSDLELRFPLSQTMMLAITHDIPAAKRLERANERERFRLLGLRKEIRQCHLSAAEVEILNRDHAAHAFKWLFSGKVLSWPPSILAMTSLNSKSVYMDFGDFAGTRNVVQYDPKMHLGLG